MTQHPKQHAGISSRLNRSPIKDRPVFAFQHEISHSAGNKEQQGHPEPAEPKLNSNNRLLVSLFLICHSQSDTKAMAEWKETARPGWPGCGASLSKLAGKWNFAWLVIFYKPSRRERGGENPFDVWTKSGGLRTIQFVYLPLNQ